MRDVIKNTKKGPKEPRINDEITNLKVKLVGAGGAMHGEMPAVEALKIAEKEGLDMVEMAPDQEIPVCKLMDYGRYRFESQKKMKEARKKQKVIHLKEIKLRPNIDVHDYEVKLRSVRKFIEAGDKVKVTLRFRGREMAHQELGVEILERMERDSADISKVESPVKMEGRQLMMILMPR